MSTEPAPDLCEWRTVPMGTYRITPELPCPVSSASVQRNGGQPRRVARPVVLPLEVPVGELERVFVDVCAKCAG
ncbi:MAG: hypothetical protein ACT4QF_04465 [Sporichthyaceae bacterium]